MEKIYQIFISSTFSDLSEERKHVSNTLSKAGHFVAGMELFPATDQQQLEYIYRVIDRCDYYVVIVAGRYGSTDKDGISFTEKEFQYARSKGLPVLAFIHRNPNGIEVGKTDQSPEKLARLNEFKASLQAGRLVDYWTDMNQLAANVIIAVSNAQNLSPGIGWVRGSSAIDPKLIQELELLRVENADLKSTLAKNSLGELIFPEHLAGPSDAIGITVQSPRQNRLPNEGVYEVKHAIILVGELFLALYNSILREPPEYQLAREIGVAIVELDRKNTFNPNTPPTLEMKEVEALRYHFESLGLIQAIGKVDNEEGFINNYIAWSITEKGRRFVALSKGIRKRAQED